MKFPGGDHLRKIRQAFFPTDAELQAAHEARLAAIAAELDARAEVKKAAAQELRRACADRLTPYIGQLFIVSNFKGVVVAERAAGIRDAVLSPANFGAEMPIGIGAVLSFRRGNHEQLVETADALKATLESSIGERVFSVPPQYESSDFWLLSLARTAEDIARRANLPTQGVGCIAVVSALDMNRQANIPVVPDPGTAFKLTGIDEARFSWEPVFMPGGMSA